LNNFNSSLNIAREMISILRINNRRSDQIYVDTIIAIGEISIHTNKYILTKKNKILMI